MKIAVKTVGFRIDELNNLLQDGRYVLDLPEPAQAKDLLKVMGLEKDYSIVCMCKGNVVDWDRELSPQDDDIMLMRAMYGG